MASKAATTPAPLPPSVEQAYRQKCVELKRRMAEVEESNDVFRLRKVRLNRGIMKLRLERAFLLEQLAARTSQNVEDSEGSPSPPPTPKEKPLRSKRGHRRPEAVNPTAADGGPASPANSNSVPPSNTRDNADDLASSPPPRPRRPRPTQAPANRRSAARRPTSAYEMFAENTTREMTRKNPALKEDKDQLHRELAQAWRDMGHEEQTKWFDMFDDLKKESKRPSEGRGRTSRRTTGDGPARAIGRRDEEQSVDRKEGVDDSGADEEAEGDGDVIMGDGGGYDGTGDDGDGDDDGEGGGFTAVNQ